MISLEKHYDKREFCRNPDNALSERARAHWRNRHDAILAPIIAKLHRMRPKSDFPFIDFVSLGDFISNIDGLISDIKKIEG